MSTAIQCAKWNWPIAILAFVAWLSIVACLDPAGSYPAMPEGPGLTVDEIFNVEQGIYLLETTRSLGWLNLVPGTSQEAFRAQNGFYNPDHPPLGRWWLGVHHHLTWWIFPPVQPEGLIVTACARTGSATAFALTMLLIGGFASAWWGRFAGVMTAISMLLMPRLFGHAHLASLETITNLTCAAAVLSVAHWWNSASPPGWRTVLLTGMLLGLALLTKIQAVLIPIPVIVWALWRWKVDALGPLFVWCLTALVVFFAGWPYLWEAPLAHVAEYLGRTTNRATIHVWYFGNRYTDKLVPWHYPFVIFGLTVPVVLQCLGLLALVRSLTGRTDLELAKPVAGPTASATDSKSISDGRPLVFERDILLGLCAFFPLVIFAMPGVSVYDGERLFLTCFPLWAVFVGRGWQIIWKLIERSTRSQAAAAIVSLALLLATALPMTKPSFCHLCYYNELVTLAMGGVERAGLEVDYWGAGVTRSLLKRVAQETGEGESIAIIPTLHQFQADEYRRQSPILRSRGIKTREFREDQSSFKSILVFRRFADVPKPFQRPDDSSGWKVIDDNRAAYFARRAD